MVGALSTGRRSGSGGTEPSAFASPASDGAQSSKAAGGAAHPLPQLGTTEAARLLWPAASSIGDLLRREGLAHPRRRRKRTPPYTEPLKHAEAPNQVWCTDFKGWFLTQDGARCDPLTITDAYSRYLLRCCAVKRTDGEHAWAVFEAAFREFGLPEAIRTDNGSPFT